MLLASLQGEYECTLTTIVLGHTDDTSRQLTDELLGATHISDRRTAEGHGNTKTLSVANSNVSAPLARCLKQGKIGCHTIDNEESLVGMSLVGHTGEILHITIVVGLLHNHSGYTTLRNLGRIVGTICNSILSLHHLNLYTMEMSVGIHHLNNLRVEGLGQEHLVGLLGCSDTHEHCLGSGG